MLESPWLVVRIILAQALLWAHAGSEWGQVAVAKSHLRSPHPEEVTAPNLDPLQPLLSPGSPHREAQVPGTHCTKDAQVPIDLGLDSWNRPTPSDWSWGMVRLRGNKWLENRGCRFPLRCPLTLCLAFSHPQVLADIDSTRKLQTIVPYEHRYKSPQQNASTIQIYVKNTRLVSHMKINHIDRIKEKTNRIISISAEKPSIWQNIRPFPDLKTTTT